MDEDQLQTSWDLRQHIVGHLEDADLHNLSSCSALLKSIAEHKLQLVPIWDFGWHPVTAKMYVYGVHFRLRAMLLAMHGLHFET